MEEPATSKLPRAAYVLCLILIVSSVDEHMASSLELLFLRNKLDFSNEGALAITHTVSMVSLFMSPFGALLTESYGNKYFIMIFFYSAIIFMQSLVVCASIPWFRSMSRNIIYTKSCFKVIMAIIVSSVPFVFDGNQFRMPNQLPALMKFYRIRYLIHNCGVLLGHYVGPVAKTSVACLGEQDCYLLPYSIGLALAIVTIIIFLLGTRLYIITKAERNMAIDIAKCLWYGFTHWVRERKSNPQEHWLDYSEPKYGSGFVTDIKTVFNMLTIFTVIPLYSAVYNQLDREWLFQAAKLDGRIGSYTFIPEHFNLINPLLALILMPIFTNVLDPFIVRWKMDRMFRRMIFGGIMVAFAFILSGVVETMIKKEDPILPNDKEVQIRIFNSFNCSCFISAPMISKNYFEVPAYGLYTNKHVLIKTYQTLYLSIQGFCFPPIKHQIIAEAGSALTLYIKNEDDGAVVVSYTEIVAKTEQGLPILTVIGAKVDDILTVADSKGVQIPITVIPLRIAGEVVSRESKRTIQVVSEKYELFMNNRKIKEFSLYQGGIYVAAIFDAGVVLFTITEPNSLHVAWILPQSVLLIFGEVYFAITFYEFNYSECPDSLKVLVASLSKFLDGVGEAFVVLILKLVYVGEDNKFYMYALLLMLNMCWLGFVGSRFKSAKSNKKFL